MTASTVETTTDDQFAFDEAQPVAKAALDRAARGLAEQLQSVCGEAQGGSLAALVAAHDARLWTALELGGPLHV